MLVLPPQSTREQLRHCSNGSFVNDKNQDDPKRTWALSWRTSATYGGTRLLKHFCWFPVQVN